MIPDLNIKATVTRTLTLEDRQFSVTDEAAGSFMVMLMPPRRSRSSDSSPRDGDPYIMRWRNGLLGPIVTPQAGFRCSLNRVHGRAYENETYEFLSDPREFRVGPVTHGIEAEVAPVGELYPYAGTLREQNGTSVSLVSVALWSDREDHADTGTYERFSGESPVEFAEAFGNNRWIDIGDKRYRVTSSITDFEGPRVKFEARRSNA